MPNRNPAQVSIEIKEKLDNLSSTIPQKPIFKVHDQLRRVNERAYEPECVAIGPLSHLRDNRLLLVQEKKLHYLRQMFMSSRQSQGRNVQSGMSIQETTVDRYVQELEIIEDEVLQQYDGIIHLPEKEFIEMMLLDGCFIIEYIRKYKARTANDADPLLTVGWISHSIRRDFLLLQNQLPFKVLTTLFELMKLDRYVNEQQQLIDLVQYFFEIPSDGLSQDINRYKHILDLVYHGMIHKISQERGDSLMSTKVEFQLIHSATELKELGIKIKLAKNRDMFDIKFNNGSLEIPAIPIEDHTESLLRNLMAYEQYCQGGKIMYVTDYVFFIDCLVSTSKDVELLRRKGIIENYLGDDELVSKMFNKMGECAALSTSCYASILIEVNQQCKKRPTRWMAILRRDYFYSPWALISVVAAFMIFVLTFTQTYYTTIAYYRKH